MSKKNNKDTKKRLHAHDLQKEKDARDKRQQALQKKDAKVTSGAIQKGKPRKAIRIRKGVRVKGIKVVDSDSKRKVRQILKAEAAMKLMDVEDDGAAKPKKKMSNKTPKKSLLKKLRLKKSGGAPAQPAGGDSMAE